MRVSARARVRLAVVGGRRGGSFNKALEVFSDKVELTAICDTDDVVRQKWAEQYPHLRLFDRFDELLEWDGCDAVLLATPVQLHARQSIQALLAGKHVLSEVVAATTLDECWELIETADCPKPRSFAAGKTVAKDPGPWRTDRRYQFNS